MGLTGYRMESHPRTKLLNWVRSCTMGCRGGGDRGDRGVRGVRGRGGHDGRGVRDVYGDHDVHGDHGASSQYPLIQCGFSCVYDGSDALVVYEACGGGDGGGDVLSLACDDGGG